MNEFCHIPADILVDSDGEPIGVSIFLEMLSYSESYLDGWLIKNRNLIIRSETKDFYFENISDHVFEILDAGIPLFIDCGKNDLFELNKLDGGSFSA